MRKWIALAVMTALVPFMGACAPTAEVAEEAAVQAVETAVSPQETMVELAEHWDAGMNAQDPDALVAMYAAEGSAIMPPEQAETIGAEAMHDFFEGFFAAGDATVTDVVESVLADGKLLAGKGSYTVEVTTADGEIATENGKWLSVNARQADGGYLVLRNIWNRDAPLPGATVPPPIAESGPEAALDAACYDSPTALDQGFEASIEAGDTAALVAAHTEDGSRIPPDMPEMVGRAQIAGYLSAAVDPFSERVLDLTDISEMVDGSVGFTHGNYMFDYTPAAGGEHVVGQGKYVAVSKLGDDGCWRLHWVLWNPDAPPA